MTRTFALPFARPALPGIGLALGVGLAAALGGCTTGPVGPTPPVYQPERAATVTVFRDGSWVGLWVPIMLRIDDRKTFLVGRNEAYSFQLDPGEYLFDFSIGFNECRRVAYVPPRASSRFRLAPNCANFDWIY